MNAGNGPTALPEPTDRELADAGLDDLMDRLRRLGDADPPPALVTALARAAFETRDLDGELAVLTADSAVDELALVRTADTAVMPRMLSFETEAVGIELQIEHTGPTVAVRGLVTGIDPGREGIDLEIDTPDRRIPLVVDPHGWFSAADMTPGALRLRLRGAAGGPVTTPWISTRLD